VRLSADAVETTLLRRFDQSANWLAKVRDVSMPGSHSFRFENSLRGDTRAHERYTSQFVGVDKAVLCRSNYCRPDSQALMRRSMSSR